MENRAHLRVEIDRPVALWLPDGSSRQVMAFNLSLGGMGILSAVPFREGSVLGMSFKLEVSEEGYDMHVQGEVMYSHLKNDSHAMGLRFIYVDDEQRVWLTRFIDYRRALRGH